MKETEEKYYKLLSLDSFCEYCYDKEKVARYREYLKTPIFERFAHLGMRPNEVLFDFAYYLPS